MAPSLDAVVVGAGPNGLAAALVLADAGLAVRVVEANATIGGGLRTAELTRPGFHHDLCSAVHPLARSSPFFRWAALEADGLAWCDPAVPLAHPLDDGTAAVLERDVDATAATLGADGPAYARLMRPLVTSYLDLAASILGPVLRRPPHPALMARFGPLALCPAAWLAGAAFEGVPARALLAGSAAHAALPLSRLGTAAFGLVLGAAGHAVGWPVARGGSQAIADALAARLRRLGVEVVVDTPIAAFEQLPPARAYLFDVGPEALSAITGARLGAGYRRRLALYRRGGAVFKLDYALAEPVPWTAAACRRAGTVHLGGPLAAIAAAEAEVARGRLPARPFVIAAQPSLVDPTRAPAGRHTLWAYAHVPRGCDVDVTSAIEAQIERFAPGFGDTVLARTASPPRAIAARNRNDVGGDITGGAHDGLQLLFRPVPRLDPYTTPDPRIFLCSASTPPGAGVHGMAGWWAARTVLRRVFGRPGPAPDDGSTSAPRPVTSS